MKTKKKRDLRRKSELSLGKPNTRRFWFRPTFYLPQNGEPFHEEINHAKKTLRATQSSFAGHRLGSPDVEVDYIEIDKGLLFMTNDAAKTT